MRIARSILVGTTLLLAAPATAAVIPVATEFGVGTATRDTATGQDWLDLSESLGTVPQIDARLTPGGDLAGWRRATTAEVVAFWASAGFVPTGSGDTFTETNDPAQVVAIATLIDLVGMTIGGGGSIDEAVGYTAEPGSAPGEWTTAWLLRRFGADDWIGAAATTGADFAAEPFSPEDQLFGSWLVRAAPVPAPPGLALLGLGLAALAARRCHQHRAV